MVLCLLFLAFILLCLAHALAEMDPSSLEQSFLHQIQVLVSTILYFSRASSLAAEIERMPEQTAELGGGLFD